MKMAMDSFIEKGPALTTLHNLDAAGPVAMGQIADSYISGLGFDEEFPGARFPHFQDNTDNMYKDLPDVTVVVDNKDHRGYWTKIADIRYGEGAASKHMYHLEFGSWKKKKWAEGPDARVCAEEPEKVFPFLKWFCTPEHRSHMTRFHDCGVINVK